MSGNRNQPQDQHETRRMLKEPRPYAGGKDWLEHSGACARIDHMLLTGATMDDLLTSGRKRSAVQSHLNHLKAVHGLAIVNEAGTYRFVANGGAVPAQGTDGGPPRDMAAAAGKPRRAPREPVARVEQAPEPLASTPPPGGGGGGAVERLFQQVEAVIRDETRRNPSEDLRRQFEIIDTRRYDRITDEPGILNNLAVQAASYSLMRRHFAVLYAEDMANFEQDFDTRVFTPGIAPALGYAEWEGLVLRWGNGLLEEEGVAPAAGLGALVEALERTHRGEWASYAKRPRARIVLSLATALPKVREQVLRDAAGFLDQHAAIAEAHPGRAYDLATRFADGIVGMGNPLVCNFFKELGLLHYVKVDVHVRDLLGGMAVDHRLNDKGQFVLSWLLARETGMAPFFVDKLLYVGGKYCKPALRELFQANRADYVEAVGRLVGEVPRYL